MQKEGGRKEKGGGKREKGEREKGERGGRREKRGMEKGTPEPLHYVNPHTVAIYTCWLLCLAFYCSFVCDHVGQNCDYCCL